MVIHPATGRRYGAPRYGDLNKDLPRGPIGNKRGHLNMYAKCMLKMLLYIMFPKVFACVAAAIRCA